MDFIIKNACNKNKEINCDNLYIYLSDIIDDINLLNLSNEDYVYVLKKKIKSIINTIKPNCILYIDIYKNIDCKINIQELSDIINDYVNVFSIKIVYNEEKSYKKIIKYIKKNYNQKQTHYIYIKEFTKDIILPFICSSSIVSTKYIILVNNYNDIIDINYIKEYIHNYVQIKCNYLYIYKNQFMNDLLLLFILYEYSNDILECKLFEDLLKYYITYINTYCVYIVNNNIINLNHFLLFIKTTLKNTNLKDYKYNYENNNIAFRYIKNIQYFMYFYTFINFYTSWIYYPVYIKKKDIIYYINSYYNFLLKIKY